MQKKNHSHDLDVDCFCSVYVIRSLTAALSKMGLPLLTVVPSSNMLSPFWKKENASVEVHSSNSFSEAFFEPQTPNYEAGVLNCGLKAFQFRHIENRGYIAPQNCLQLLTYWISLKNLSLTRIYTRPTDVIYLELLDVFTSRKHQFRISFQHFLSTSRRKHVGLGKICVFISIRRPLLFIATAIFVYSIPCSECPLFCLETKI